MKAEELLLPVLLLVQDKRDTLLPLIPTIALQDFGRPHNERCMQIG